MMATILTWFSLAGFVVAVTVLEPWGIARLQSWADMEGTSLRAQILFLFIGLLVLTSPFAFMHWVAVRAVFR